MIYFDNAATSFPKPAAVVRAAADAMRLLGNPGRGGHRLAMQAAETVYACRKSAAALFGASPERVIFTSGATMALNLAIKGAHRQYGGAILISDMEHNAVVRPAEACGEVKRFDSHPKLWGDERRDAILASAAAMSEGVGVMVCTAASNIIGASMPIHELGELCAERGIFFIVDGAQAGGILPLSVERDRIGALCLPGHKGLLGPMGCGMLILGGDVTLPTLIEGGSGVLSAEREMPPLPPERYEAGTLPVPAIAGLRRGIGIVRMETTEVIRAAESRLAERLKNALVRRLGGAVKLYAPQHEGGIVLFSPTGMDAETLAARLDACGICVRAGLHCAPEAHARIGSDGAVRVSFGVQNRAREVDEFVRAVENSMGKA